MLKTLEKSFSNDFEASFSVSTSSSSSSKRDVKHVPDVKILLKRVGEIRQLMSNLSAEQTQKKVQVRVEPIVHAQDDAVRQVLRETIYLTRSLKERNTRAATRTRTALNSNVIPNTGTILA